jgi:hypothetical protein
VQKLRKSVLRNTLKESHYWLSGLLAVALIPALKRLGLPVGFDWGRLIVSYWLVLAAQSVCLAVLLLFADSPARVFRCFWQRLRRNRLLIVLVVIYFVVLALTLSWFKATVLTVDTLALLEFRDRTTSATRRSVVYSVLVSALYLFAGFLLVFAYNDVILSLRFFGSADVALNSVDEWLLRGWSVSRICAWAATSLPHAIFVLLEFIYFGMFTQIGAALILSSSLGGRKNGLRFVGTILTAYYLALMLFYLWPSQGPYYLSGGAIPHGLMVSEIQRQSVLNSAALWSHRGVAPISTDYYIAFPCMHIAQPLIVMWFLRRSRRMVSLLAAYDILLVPAILLLEWHYFVDILGGVLVAGLAIVAVNFDQSARNRLAGETNGNG